MGYDITEEEIITLVDERITVMTEPQTRRIDRLENALVQLADAHRRTEEAQKRTEEALVQLADAQRHMTHQLHNLTSVVNKMQQTQVTILQKQDAMEQTQVAMQEDIRTLQKDVRRLDNRMAKLAGDSLEERYLKHAAAYLGRALRKAKAFKPYVMEDQLRAKLSEADYEDLLLVDLLVRGIPKGHKGLHVWLAFEISVVVDRKDVERAIRRAEILHRAGFIGVPAVAGESLTQGAETLASSEEVVIVTNGKMDHWKEALARALAAKPSSA